MLGPAPETADVFLTPTLGGRVATATEIRLMVVRLTAPTATVCCVSHLLVAVLKTVDGVRPGATVSVPAENSRGSVMPSAQSR